MFLPPEVFVLNRKGRKEYLRFKFYPESFIAYPISRISNHISYIWNLVSGILFSSDDGVVFKKDLEKDQNSNRHQ